jgi:GNAT superfamily N-acetyltransferase
MPHARRRRKSLRQSFAKTEVMIGDVDCRFKSADGRGDIGGKASPRQPVISAKFVPSGEQTARNIRMGYSIRHVTANDAEAIAPLLESLGYPNELSSLKSRITIIAKNPDAELLVAINEPSNELAGLLSLHFIPQLGIEGEVARIGFFVVDPKIQRMGVGKFLESHAEKLCLDRGCNRMVLL